MMGRRNKIEDFWNYVNKTDTCWLWTGSLRGDYGRFYLNMKTLSAHRLSYELKHGAVPKGLVLDHLCRVPRCVNPEHLEAVPQKVNANRGLLKGHVFNRGEAQGSSKLKEYQVIEIREKYKTGTVSKQQLADEYGMSRRAIGLIISRRNWAHVK